MVELLIKIALAYLLGSVSGSMVIGALRHVDIRQSGSGNAGGTNAFRTQGFRFALGVVIIDVGKGFLAAWLVPQLSLSILGAAVPVEIQVLCCGFAVVVGHCYPLFYGFRGGKGAATAVGAMIVIEPAIILPMFLTWLLVLVLTGWVGLSTMLAAVSLVPAMLWLDSGTAKLVFAILLAAFIVF
ncbi:MAG: glycerol-3-phosphate acyltransferase, partial [Gammaproteobacteria bacterium]|nr:glycerol-3-phosphate acyltransferase [Gammaproteobacteria bacterium]